MCDDTSRDSDPPPAAPGQPPGAYEFVPGQAGASPGGPSGPSDHPGQAALDASLLAENALWFCYLRWVVIAVLTVFGLLGILPGFFASMGLRKPGVWPFVTAGVLVLTNVAYLASIKTTSRRTDARPRYATAALWVQIALDLIVLTCVVYFVGPTRTYIPFAYLFHIALACIFFPYRQSLAVTLIACALYAACIVAVSSGLLPPTHLFIEPAGDAGGPDRALPALNFIMAIGIWLVVWYLVSHLAAMVRQRDADLHAANERLKAAMAERRRHMLTTTHQLKSPFAAIQANAQLLLEGYCGTLPDEARAVTQRIATRCRALAAEIQEMLQLANLSSTSQRPLRQTALELADVLEWGMGILEPTAQSRRITFDCDMSPARVVAAEDHLKMLLMNFLSNAINYSHDGGTVRVACGRGDNGRATVTIADEGIGIPAAKIPHIFEEHYRTTEAARHNKQSTGLGLAIARHVAELYTIHIRVTSQPGRGTTIELIFPQTPVSHTKSQTRENAHGIPADSGR